MLQKSVGVGLISIGWMGQLHSRSYQSVNTHFPDLDSRPELVIAANLTGRGTAERVTRLGYREGTTDYREVLAHPDVDVVSICAPNFLHREIGLAAAKAGKPFWIEKPMGRNFSEAQDIANAAHQSELITAVGFNYRHAPAIEHARELINDGELGDITNIRVAFLSGAASDPTDELTWRYTRDRAGHGVMGDVLVHGIDLAHYLVGPIVEVCAMTETFITHRPLPKKEKNDEAETTGIPSESAAVENEDYAAMLARFSTGAVGTFESTRVAVGPHAEYTVEVYGTKGSLRWDLQRLNELQLANAKDGSGYRTIFSAPGFGEFGRFQPGAGIGMGYDDLKVIEAYQFLRSVSERKQLAPSVHDGLSAVAVGHAADMSTQTRTWQTVAPIDGFVTYNKPRP